MKERVDRICVTCQHYEPYHCTVDDHYIGYVDCEMKTDCRTYRLHENYKRGGKWYDSRPDKQVRSNAKYEGRKDTARSAIPIWRYHAQL